MTLETGDGDLVCAGVHFDAHIRPVDGSQAPGCIDVHRAALQDDPDHTGLELDLRKFSSAGIFL